MTAETVVIVITRDTVNVSIHDDNMRGIGEVYCRTPAGEVDQISGNFEDEPELDDALAEALMSLQPGLLNVQEQLQQQKGE